MTERVLLYFAIGACFAFWIHTFKSVSDWRQAVLGGLFWPLFVAIILVALLVRVVRLLKSI
jgi:hypothetical protein